MTQLPRLDSRLLAAATVFAGLLLLAGCKAKDPPAALVADASAATAPDGGSAAVDINQCAACQNVAPPSWSFQGIYRDAACTEPLAQLAPPACAVVPALGATNLTYTDELGPRKAGEVAAVTLAEQIAPDAARYRKAGKDCVRANESAVDVTPAGCGGSRVCRDASGALACSNCRTFANGCPDFEETRMYASIDDPATKAPKAAAGGGNLARLRQCCTQLASEAKRLGSSPEGGMLLTAAGQCTAIVNAAGPNGNAPELGALRALLAGRNVPAVCAGF